MKWSLSELNKYKEDALQFSETLDLEKSLLERESEIVAVEPVKVNGAIVVSDTGYIAHFTIKTTLILPSTRSLIPVPYPCDLTIDEIYMTPKQYEEHKEFVDEESVMILENDVLNLEEAVEDHLLLTIPLQILTEEEQISHESIKGNDWELVSEEEYERRKMQRDSNKIDPRLAKLSALLDNNKEPDEE